MRERVHQTRTNTFTYNQHQHDDFFFLLFLSMFLVFKLIFNRQSKLCGGSLRLCFDVSHISEGCRCRSHCINVGSFQRLLEISNICNEHLLLFTNFPPSLTHSLTLYQSPACSFVLNLYSLECISTLMKYDRYDRMLAVDFHSLSFFSSRNSVFSV